MVRLKHGSEIRLLLEYSIEKLKTIHLQHLHSKYRPCSLGPNLANNRPLHLTQRNHGYAHFYPPCWLVERVFTVVLNSQGCSYANSDHFLLFSTLLFFVPTQNLWLRTTYGCSFQKHEFNSSGCFTLRYRKTEIWSLSINVWYYQGSITPAESLRMHTKQWLSSKIMILVSLVSAR